MWTQNNDDRTRRQRLQKEHLKAMILPPQFGMDRFCFGNIWVLPWLILWYEKLYPAFDKPQIYYRVKAWFISLKEQSTVGICIYSCIDFLIKLCLITYGTMVVFAGFILAGGVLVLPLLVILRLIFR